MREFICPECRIELSKRHGNGEIFWECKSCGGRSSTISLMRKALPRYIINDIWQKVRNFDYPQVRHCSCCPGMMEQVPVQSPYGEMHIDVCERCHFVWFDAHEYAALPVEAATRQPVELPYKAKEQMAVWRLRQLEERGRLESMCDAPDEVWKYIPAIFGLPVEVDCVDEPVDAWATWVTAALIIFVNLFTINAISKYAPLYGLVPADYFRLGGLTFLTSFFLHAGPVHLLGNLYFLLAFGDNVEGLLGKWRFVLLLLFATLLGGVMHVLVDPASAVPCVGASGGISGVLAFYALSFPKNRLAVFLWWLYKFTWTRIPAFAFFAGWILLQIIGGFSQADGVGAVSYMAHLGGALAGAGFWLIWRFARI